MYIYIVGGLLSISLSRDVSLSWDDTILSDFDKRFEYCISNIDDLLYLKTLKYSTRGCDKFEAFWQNFDENNFKY